MWHKGPLPKDSWGWGAVVLVGQRSGFHFADFRGDHVHLQQTGRRIAPDQIAAYNNSITLPPKELCEPQVA